MKRLIDALYFWFRHIRYKHFWLCRQISFWTKLERDKWHFVVIIFRRFGKNECYIDGKQLIKGF